MLGDHRDVDVAVAAAEAAMGEAAEEIDAEELVPQARLPLQGDPAGEIAGGRGGKLVVGGGQHGGVWLARA
jgi:hypothetical protein